MVAIDPRHQRQLDQDGFVVLEDLMGAQLLGELGRAVDRLFQLEGEQAGSEFKQEAGSRRLANLVNKGAVFSGVVVHPLLLPYVETVLGPDFKLSSLNARRAMPQTSIAQPLHADMAAVLDERGYWVCNSVWMLDDFTPENGPLRVVPGTHRLGRLPQEILSNPAAAHPDEIQVLGKAGTVVVMNAHLWHGGLANRTDRPRTAVHGFYTRRDKPQQQYQKELLSLEVQAALSPQLRHILALDDPRNDELSASVQVRSGFLK